MNCVFVVMILTNRFAVIRESHGIRARRGVEGAKRETRAKEGKRGAS